MRVLAGIGALVFLYLAVIPAGLIVSTLDSACSGTGCETSLISKVAFTAMYGLCLAAVLGCAVRFARHARRGTWESQEHIGRGLLAAAFVVGFALFVLFAMAYPLGAAIALVPAGLAYLLIERSNRRERARAPGATFASGGANGFHGVNGANGANGNHP